MDKILVIQVNNNQTLGKTKARDKEMVKDKGQVSDRVLEVVKDKVVQVEMDLVLDQVQEQDGILVVL